VNWELVAQIAVLALVLLFVGIIAWSVWDVVKKNEHERNLETLREAHELRAASVYPRTAVVEAGAVVINNGERQQENDL
jgi:uncharacterized membrane protein